MAMYAFVLPRRMMLLPRVIVLPATVQFKLLAAQSDDEDRIILETPSQAWEEKHFNGLRRHGLNGRIITMYAKHAVPASSMGQLKFGRLENGMLCKSDWAQNPKGDSFRHYTGLVNSHQDFPDRDQLFIYAPLWSGLRVTTSFSF